ncbi:MAG: MFS transporter [Longispora sp.]|nr:MFS transporter [Longispora sp. (in: high G+C Gram-positive bacteria)]
MDISPLRASHDFRLLMASGTITMIGSFITFIAVPVQVKELTGSYLAVGLVGVAEFLPMVIFGIYGGALADALDRKRMVVICEVGLLLSIAFLIINAMLPQPLVWPLYIFAALVATFNSLQRPSLEGLIPRYVPHNMMQAAAALSSLRWNIGAILGPALGGLVVVIGGVATAYALDAVTFGISLLLLLRLTPAPAGPDAQRASLSTIAAGLRYAVSRRDLVGTYVVDIVVMAFAMPQALFPFLADQIGAPWALGMLYSAGAVGSLAVALTSGWTTHVHRHGLAVILAAAGWGLAITLAGWTTNLTVILICLAIAGGADMISGIFRSTIWNQSIPDELRGRLAGIELLSYSSGPMLGNARAGFVAQLTGVRFSIVSGGLLCFGAVTALAAALADFRRYDARTDPHVLAEKARRATNPGT